MTASPHPKRAVHTPVPWWIGGKATIKGGFDHSIASIIGINRDANAAFILLASNNHDRLVLALRDAQKRLIGLGALGGTDDPVNAALALAGDDQ